MDIVIKNLSEKQLKVIKALAEILELEMLTVDDLEELEDQALALAMDEARNEGYLGQEESKKVIQQLKDEVRHYQKISKRSKKN
jgi:hypothetical protein